VQKAPTLGQVPDQVRTILRTEITDLWRCREPNGVLGRPAHNIFTVQTETYRGREWAGRFIITLDVLSQVRTQFCANRSIGTIELLRFRVLLAKLLWSFETPSVVICKEHGMTALTSQ